ncbi:MAG: hypothetical protein AB1742_10905 [bacterium]
MIDKRNIEVLDDGVARILREKTPQQRLAVAFGLWDSAKKMLTGFVRSQHPEWSDSRVESEVAGRLSHGAVSAAVQTDKGV